MINVGALFSYLVMAQMATEPTEFGLEEGTGFFATFLVVRREKALIVLETVVDPACVLPEECVFRAIASCAHSLCACPSASNHPLQASATLALALAAFFSAHKRYTYRPPSGSAVVNYCAAVWSAARGDPARLVPGERAAQMLVAGTGALLSSGGVVWWQIGLLAGLAWLAWLIGVLDGLSSLSIARFLASMILLYGWLAGWLDANDNLVVACAVRFFSSPLSCPQA